MFAEVEKLGSKSEGGEWVLARDPDNNLVKNALLVRQGKSTISPEPEMVKTYLQHVHDFCSGKLSTISQI